MSNARQEMILKLIHARKINTQDDLQKLLAQSGFPVTQATVSRDIRTLQLIKKADENGFYYYQERDSAMSAIGLLANNVIKIDHAGTIMCVKCRSGTAQAVCTILDDLNHPEIVGTIAGDDTIFVLVRSSPQARKLAEELTAKLQNR